MSENEDGCADPNLDRRLRTDDTTSFCEGKQWLRNGVVLISVEAWSATFLDQLKIDVLCFQSVLVGW